MNILDDWARDFRIDRHALKCLKLRLGVAPDGAIELFDVYADKPGSEARQQALVRIEAADKRIRLYRNNSGAYVDDTGRQVRYGLANESKQVNAVLKSPDLIGWRKREIMEDDVGTVIGQCVLREMKHEGWVFNPKDAHENAQWNFLRLAIADGCDAMFATGPGTL